VVEGCNLHCCGAVEKREEGIAVKYQTEKLFVRKIEKIETISISQLFTQSKAQLRL